MRQSMEQGFGGEDFSQVRLHDDSVANEAADSIGAKAFTLGHHIVGSVKEPEVMAHELQHVRQQTGDASQATSGTVQRMLKGTAKNLREDAGTPSAKAKLKGFVTAGRSKSNIYSNTDCSRNL